LVGTDSPLKNRVASRIAKASHFLHEYFLWALLASYAIAAVFPAFGLWIRTVPLGEYVFFRQDTKITLPMLMLALLLLNAGLGVEIAQLRGLFRKPLALGAGLVVNLVVPIGFIFIVARGMRFWHNSDEAQNILVGVALIASMPIAGSSTAWTQNANGNLALSLGLALLSTFLSPLTAPVSLGLVSMMAKGGYSQLLLDLAGHGAEVFLVICVMAPSLLGVLLNWLIGPTRIESIKPELKLFNSVNLLLLNYSNAAVSLPQIMENPDWDFLVVALTISVSLCLLCFASGWVIARLLKTDLAKQVALMFGLGMNNNGAGLVLASMTLAAYPRVMLPVIFYNLTQHLMAGGVDFVFCRMRANQDEGPTQGAWRRAELPGRG